jgi:hypothetical protein
MPRKVKCNRDYTGLVRTPPSMAWLIRNREAIKGSMDWRENRIKADRQNLAELKRQLKAVDSVIRSHEVTVEPEIIKGRKTYRERIAAHGEIRRFLMAQLRLAGDTPVGTTELALRFLGHLKKTVTMGALRDTRTRVGMSLAYGTGWLVIFMLVVLLAGSSR